MRLPRWGGLFVFAEPAPTTGCVSVHILVISQCHFVEYNPEDGQDGGEDDYETFSIHYYTAGLKSCATEDQHWLRATGYELSATVRPPSSA